jgi:tetratricopeptide (TPR) repeat protein
MRRTRIGKVNIIGILTIVMLMLFSCVALAGPKVVVNSKKVDAESIMENGRILVPLRVIFEALEAEVNWIPEPQTIKAVSKHNAHLTLQIGNTKASLTREGETKEIILDVPPRIVNGRTLVPLRFVSESFNKDVRWEVTELTAYINDPENYEHYIGEAGYYYDHKDFGKALFYFDKAVKSQPDVADNYYKRALCQFELGKLNAAVFELDKAISLDPEQVEYYRLRATCHDKLGNSDLANLDWDKVK